VSETQAETAIDATIAAASALNPALLDDRVMNSLITDLAQDIFTKQDICVRYGLTMADLLDFVRRPGLAIRIKQRRAVFMSGDSIEDRNRAYFGMVTLEAAPKLDRIIHDDKTPAATKLDAITTSAKIAGIFTTGGPKSVQGSTQVGSQFSVNITFSGRPPVQLGTVIEAEQPYVAIETVPTVGASPPDDDDGFVPDDDA
jgi:hypothetical protein